jgi:hypothetical protein
MTLRFDWLHLPRWMGHAHVSHAMSVVLGVIVVSLAFSALRVIDAEISGALIDSPRHAAAVAAAPSASDAVIVDPPTSPGGPVDASLVEVPSASADAISL